MLNIKLAKLMFIFDINEDYIISESVRMFEVSNADCVYKINVIVNHVDSFNPLNCKIVKQVDDKFLIMNNENDDLEYRLYFHPVLKIPYVLYRELDNNKIELDILKIISPKIIVDINFLEYIALEKHLLKVNSFILHSSSILIDKGAILFSAPSGTGKSTQANLWNKYRGSKILNGDRNILEITNDEVIVHGLPFCGSSNVYTNFNIPLKSIVLLGQSKVDNIVELSKIDKITKIYSECTVNNWNEKCVNKVFDLIEILISNVEIFKLTCTMNETAVECLEKYLEICNETI